MFKPLVSKALGLGITYWFSRMKEGCWVGFFLFFPSKSLKIGVKKKKNIFWFLDWFLLMWQGTTETKFALA